MGDVVMWWWD